MYEIQRPNLIIDINNWAVSVQIRSNEYWANNYI